MHRFRITAVAAGLIGGTMLLFAAAPASAATLPSLTVAAPAEAGMVEKVQRRGDRRVRRGDRARSYSHRGHRAHRSRSHASRSFRHHRGPSFSRSFRHHHRHYRYGPSIGFSFIVPGVTLGIGGGSSSHVDWCLNRYRSYDPSTDTFLGYDGYRHRCNSPYR
jgi:Ni/Co efflux regulator RcnB